MLNLCNIFDKFRAFHSFQQFWEVPQLHLLQDKDKINGSKTVHVNMLSCCKYSIIFNSIGFVIFWSINFKIGRTLMSELYNSVQIGIKKKTATYRACLHENESRFERRFGTWFGPFLIWKPDFSPCEHKAVSNQAFETRFETRKKGFLDRDSRTKPDSRTCERKALSERDSCVCILKMRAEALMKPCMGQSVGTKYCLAVRKSWSWLGRRLQCMWTHVVQITIPIMFWIAIRNIFRNMLRSHVKTAIVSLWTYLSHPLLEHATQITHSFCDWISP